MEIRDPESIKKIKEARKYIDLLQTRLLKCEEELDNLARATEIAMISQQYQLLLTFLQGAREILEDRLTMPEISEELLNRPLTIVHDDRQDV